MKIYIDLLILTNFILTMVYLETLGKLVHRKISGGRLAVSSIIGGLFSLIIVMNGASYPIAWMITVLKGVGIMLTLLFCFKYKSVRQYFKYLFIYCAVRLVYLGATLVFWQLSDSKKIYVRNYTFYFDISLLKLTLAVITAYIILSLYEFFTSRNSADSTAYTAIFKSGDYTLKLPAVSDSGNKLRDSFTGIPIVIFYCSELYSHYKLDENYENLNGFRLVPFNTVNGGGLIPVTAKGEVTIIDNKDNAKQIKCCVGILKSDNSRSRAIFDPILLQ